MRRRPREGGIEELSKDIGGGVRRSAKTRGVGGSERWADSCSVEVLTNVYKSA